MTRIVTYAHRPKRAPKKKAKAAAITGPAIVTATSKRDRDRRREADDGQEASPGHQRHTIVVARFEADEITHRLRAAPASSPARPRTAPPCGRCRPAVSRHKTLDVLSGYVRDADALKDHAGAAFL